DENGKPDRRLRGRDRQHDQRIDLADQVAEEGGEGDKVDVDREQNELDRHQDDDDVLAVEKDAEDAEREQDGGDGEIMSEPDDHDSPCPGRTWTMSMAVALPRPTCAEMF